MGTVYLIPCNIAEDALHVLPAYVKDAIMKCEIIFAENERTARRYFKAVEQKIVIDHYEWFSIHKAEAEVVAQFKSKLQAGKIIGIISESGCPGVADPGQVLVQAAQELNARIVPLVGPSSILLALMASGMNGQQFEFVGYLPIDAGDRSKKIKELEIASAKNNSTKIFIETPYRNKQLLDTLLKTCEPHTKLCIAVNITSSEESIKTLAIKDWKKQPPALPKQPAIFLLHAH